jgi:Phosphatidylinositol-4-phosphate 5-Kinase
MTNSDLRAFKKLFRDYFSHVSSRPGSLLARMYGVYTVKMKDMIPVHLVLMGNTMKVNPENIIHVFDLKGSFVNREVRGNNIKPTTTLKDLNLLELCKDELFLNFTPEDIRVLADMMDRDSELLLKYNLMDYSLLFAVERNQ